MRKKRQYVPVEVKHEVVGLREVARRLNLSTVAANNLRRKGMPQSGAGFPWPESLHWYMEQRISAEIERRAPRGNREVVRNATAEIELRRAEMDLAREEGQLLSIDYIEEQLTRIAARLAARCRAVPGKWAPQVVGLRSIAEGQARLEEITRELLTSLSETGDDDELDIENPDQLGSSSRGVETPSKRRAPRRSRSTAKTHRK